MKKDFSRVLITGTTSGLGKSLSAHYHAKQIEVLTVNRRETGEVGNTVLDITDFKQVRAYLVGLQAKKQLPDLLILNAGINQPDNVNGFNLNLFSEIWKINFVGVLNFVSALQELKIKDRTIVSFSSTSNIVPNPGHLGYFLSKRALLDSFRLLQKNDPSNTYKTVVLSPVHTNIMAGYSPPKGLQGQIFNLLAVTSDKAATALSVFFESRDTVFYFTKKACAFYFCVRLILKFLPSLYSGTSAPTISASTAPLSV